MVEIRLGCDLMTSCFDFSFFYIYFQLSFSDFSRYLCELICG